MLDQRLRLLVAHQELVPFFYHLIQILLELVPLLLQLRNDLIGLLDHLLALGRILSHLLDLLLVLLHFLLVLLLEEVPGLAFNISQRARTLLEAVQLVSLLLAELRDVCLRITCRNLEEEHQVHLLIHILWLVSGLVITVSLWLFFVSIVVGLPLLSLAQIRRLLAFSRMHRC